ncbi:G-type lectin S-receptor-like serine/threonine-protein kinase B120 [Magnolia sinica]|uniref:G-type lectin S-receptor-like serine/threonine-protein kinase B120 n=1 Tax=Magnolia sinica TaxID=86752 RepID=UPI00265845C9|nr:G-type lectin S-receptor-like serine/threonine-protein kinase B120 [Magnolia sinica]
MMDSQKTLFLSLIVVLYLPQFSNGVGDRLMKGGSLKDGQTLISARGIFELGFFSPRNSTDRYIGIWYKNITETTIVWVANRDNPLKDNSGVLRFRDAGYMIVEDKNKNYFYIPEISHDISATGSMLLDSGNFILTEGSSDNDNRQIVWQSFDYPTDTLLPGMRLQVNVTTRESRSLTSWRSSEDPAPGDFSFGCSPDTSGQLLVRQGEAAYWIGRIGEGTGSNNFYSFSTNDLSLYWFTFSVVKIQILTRFTMDFMGQIKQLTWSDDTHKWELVWHAPEDECHASCGYFGVCNLQSSSSCSCIPGFEPASLEQWILGDWSRGCVRKTYGQCQENSSVNRENDAFIAMVNVRLPINMQLVEVGSSTECVLACLSNCSCTAYIYGLKCFVWIGDLLNLQQLPSSTSYGGVLNIRISPEEIIYHGNKRWLRIVIAVIVAMAIFLLGLLIGCYLQRENIKRRGEKESQQEVLLLEFGEGRNNDPELQLFSFASVSAATNNFWDANKLGQGGFGPVYKGKLLDGREIAVKRLSKSSRQGLEEFKNEVVLIAKLQHMNLVRLLGCCIEREEMILLYDYMPNKSLDSYLFDATKRVLLDWGKRRHIINGIAQGILYLHKYSRLKIIHRDLKASNILLDGEMNPKISDFGLARMFIGNETQANTNRVVGTYGYMSPEYAMEGHFSIKSDVFSFGVLLLEIMTGKKNTGLYIFDCPRSLLGYSWELWKRGWGSELMDMTLVSLSSKQELLRYIHVGLLCVQENAADRPTMSEVIYMLANETGTLPTPKQPAFSFGRSVVAAELPTSRLAICSINEVTISELDGR